MFRRYIFLQILNNFFSILQDTAAMCLSRNITLNHSIVADLVITCRIFLGFEFLVRKEKKNGISHEKREKNEKNPAL